MLRNNSDGMAATPSEPQTRPMTMGRPTASDAKSRCSSGMNVKPQGLRTPVEYFKCTRMRSFSSKNGATKAIFAPPQPRMI